MKWRKLTPRRLVILYFACFALAWAILAATLAGAPAPESGHGALSAGRANGSPVGLLVALAAHAALVAGLAWQAQRRFFAHGALAVLTSSLPLVVLVAELWFVAAFFYLIAALHVAIACRHESIGKVQSTHLPSTQSGRL